jgi:hypothetical protein
MASPKSTIKFVFLPGTGNVISYKIMMMTGVRNNLSFKIKAFKLTNTNLIAEYF